MNILLEKSGVLSTIQDLGRNGFRRFGINPNGAMDVSAARLINMLLGNSESEAVLEMHFPAPVLKFEKPAIIALGGADFGAMLDDKTIENWRPYFVEKNRVLSFPKKNFGNRAYLSLKGGFKIDCWLESASTNLTANIGGFEGRSLMKNDKLFFKQRTKDEGLRTNFKISKSIIPRYSSLPTVRVVAGAEYERLTAFSEQNFTKQNFTISRSSNRMGFRLDGEPLYLLDKIELVSSAVSFGTIQLLPDGQMIVLMADHQTSGGYPRIAHVVSADLPILAQLGGGDKVNFELISLEEAEELTLQFERDLSFLKVGVNSKYAVG
ncbi:MAG: biotin-dependent carboxyltransferase family protein [Pyrinomonadaceae bacterium]|nr:biotin-dependent carboxyltransferase family protein [Pyrinomonadaceae bacterium]